MAICCVRDEATRVMKKSFMNYFVVLDSLGYWVSDL